MRVLHYSDRQELEIDRFFLECDVMFATGDLTIFDFKAIEEKIVAKPCFGVYGNHDVPGYLEELGIKNVHLKVFELGQFAIGGYQGCLRYKDSGGPQFTEEEAEKDLADFPRVDILLLHAAPFGLLDTPGDPVHEGSKSVRAYVDRTRPGFIFCGHNSPSAEMDYGGIKIFRTHKVRLVEIYT